MKTIKVCDLVFDEELYPRNNIDTANVTALVEALTHGAELPPIVIDQKKRLIDGVHRWKAYKRLYGDDYEIECIQKRYKKDADAFLDAMRYNGSHGARLDQCDRTRCLIISERLGLTIDLVAGALHVPADKLGALRNDRVATTQSGLSVPLKRTVRHFAGQTLTKRQMEANDALSGMRPAFYANQLIQLIEADMLPKDDDGLLLRLKRLHELLEGMLVV